MRILVVSDTHGDLRTLLQIVKSQPTAEIIIHCGDGNEEAQYIKDSYRDKMVVAVKGNFDDAQTGVKKIFTDSGFIEQAKSKGYALSSANSINWGRLVPQVVYYFSAYCDLLKTGNIEAGEEIDFVLDKPFMFVVTGADGAVLFTGIVKNIN